MDLVQLTATQIALLGLIIAGITELFNRLRGKDYWVAASIVTSAIVGGFIGMFYGIDFVSGMGAGLTASGFLKTISVVGRKSEPTPSTLTNSGVRG